MKNMTVLGFAALVSLSFPAIAQDADTAELSKKLTLAKQYSQLVPAQGEVDKAIENLLVKVPVAKRPILKSALERNIKVDRLTSVSQMALADVFTIEELEALVAFYSTPEGLAIKQKMPLYQEKLAPVLSEMIRDAVESYDNQVK